MVEESVQPALEEYRKAKIVAPQEIAEFIEAISYDTTIIRQNFDK